MLKTNYSFSLPSKDKAMISGDKHEGSDRNCLQRFGANLCIKDKFVIKNRMESGTILRLALLRKIRSRQPLQKTSQKLQRHRNLQSYYSSRTPSTSHTSRELSQNYALSKERLNFVRRKTNSLDQIPRLQNRSAIMDQEAFTLSGWNNNEQEYDYKKVIKKQTFRLPDSQPLPFQKTTKNCEKPINRRKFTYCEQHIKQFFKEFNFLSIKGKTKSNQPTAQNSKKVKSLRIEDTKIKQNFVESKCSFELDKQNQFCDYFKPDTVSVAKKRLTQNKVMKITNLVKEFDDWPKEKRM